MLSDVLRWKLLFWCERIAFLKMSISWRIELSYLVKLGRENLHNYPAFLYDSHAIRNCRWEPLGFVPPPILHCRGQDAGSPESWAPPPGIYYLWIHRWRPEMYCSLVCGRYVSSPLCIELSVRNDVKPLLFLLTWILNESPGLLDLATWAIRCELL